MTKSYQICITACTGVLLLSWEVLALIFQGWTGKKWGAALFAFLGGFAMASGLIGTILWNMLTIKKEASSKGKKDDPQELPTIEVTPIDEAPDEDSVVETVEEENRKRQRKADFIFDIVNLSTALLAIVFSVLFLNTFTSLWLEDYMHGNGYVRLEYGLGEGTLSMVPSSSPLIKFYNSEMSENNRIEYKHGWRKFCAAPIISQNYNGKKKNYTGYWGRCTIGSNSDCTSSLKHECLLNFGKELTFGRRASKEEEQSLGTELQKLSISDDPPVVVDVNDPKNQLNSSKKGLLFGLLNLIWFIPTLVTVLIFSL